MEKYTVEIDNDKTIRWYKFNTKIFHREDGPAVEYVDGHKEWYQNGLCHRLDGPAIEYSHGGKSWYLKDIKYTEEQFLKHTTKQVSCDGKVFTDEDGNKYKLIIM